ncbi:MAG TPA: glycosyltransferase family protein [Bryobacteraceae bacterium]|nr:glycosyltransferase family protein [Bryobacteraceae bacterium]
MHKPRIVAIVQARMGSLRLPGKVLRDIHGEPMLNRVLSRVKRAVRLDDLVVATTSLKEDDDIADLVSSRGFLTFRGAKEDVLDRYYRAARLSGAELIVRITADCPLIAPELIDRAIEEMLSSQADYVSNSRPHSSYPEGLDVEIIRFEALQRAWREATLTSEREHVTPYIWKGGHGFSSLLLTCPEPLPRVRLTVDEPADLEFMNELYARIDAGAMPWATLLRWILDNRTHLPANLSIARDAGYQRSLSNDLPISLPAASSSGSPRTVAIVQARLNSTRLPRKTIVPICGKPLLEHVFERIRACRLIHEVTLATTNDRSDRQLIHLASRNGIAAYAGSGDDVLDRFYQAARRFHAETIVRVTADDPFKDPEIVDEVIGTFLGRGPLDYCSNTIEPSYPEGLDIEVFSFHALERAWREATLASDREHVTPYIWRHPEMFRLASVKLGRNLSHLRWTLDYEEDLKFTQEVYARLYRGQIFGMEAILALIENEPWLSGINAGFLRNAGYHLSLECEAK